MRTSILSLALSGLFPVAGLAQGPLLQATLPAAHSINGSRTGAVQLTFSQAVPSTGAIQLSTNMQGRRTGTVSGVGTQQLSFQPTQPFAPGERVSLTVPANVSQRPRVVEFRAAAGSGNGQFGAPTTVGLTSGARPASVVAGDLDHDGDIDLVAGDANGATVCLNDGRGQFTAAATTFPIAPRSGDLQLADVNGDGHLDLLSSGLITPAVYLNLGTGNGTFEPAVLLLQPVFPAQAITGDFNADGLADVVVGEPVGTSLRLYFFAGNTRGNLASPTISASQVPGRDLAAADFDEDGDLDLLMVSDRLVSVCLNDGTGQFSSGASQTVTSQSAELTLGDFTGDGHLDAVCTNATTASLTLVPGTGTGAWQQARAISVVGNTWHIRSADINGDGRLDLLAPNDRSGLQVLLNDGTGQFTAGAFLTGAQAFTHADAADLNGDGILDVYTGHQTLGSTPLGIDVFFHQSAATPTATRPRTLASFEAFPNPAHAQLHLRLPAGTTLLGLELRDALGRLVRTLSPAPAGSRGEYTISLTGLAPGRYALLARSATAQGVQWVSVE